MSDVAETLTVIEGGKSLDSQDRTPVVVGSKPWSSKVRRRAKELVSELELGYMEMARILYQVYDTPIDGDRNRAAVHTAWGYQTFRDYVEQELGINIKKAERLRRIWFCLEVQLKDLDPELKERVVRLGFSKVRELVKVLSLRNAKSWIEMAEQNTYAQIEKAVTQEKRSNTVAETLLGDGADAEIRALAEGQEEGDADLMPPQMEKEERPTQERFDLFPNQLEVVHQALKKASVLSGSDKKGHLLDLICTDFVATNDTFAHDRDSRVRYITKLERILGLKLVAVDPETRDVVYGIEALELVANQ